MGIDWAERINDAVAGTIVGRRFRLDGSGHVSRMFSISYPHVTDHAAGESTQGIALLD